MTSFAIITPIDISSMADSPFGVMTHFAQFHDQSVMPLIARARNRSHSRRAILGSHRESKGECLTIRRSLPTTWPQQRRTSLTPFVILDWANPFYDYEAGVFTAPHTDNGRQGYANYALNRAQQIPSRSKRLRSGTSITPGRSLRVRQRQTSRFTTS